MENKFLFIHIPKCAGTTVQRCLVEANKHTVYNAHHNSFLSKEFVKKNCNYEWFNFENHIQSYQDETITAFTGKNQKEKVDPSSCVKFTVIRNPYDWLTSYVVSRWGDHSNTLPAVSAEELIKLYCTGDLQWPVPLLQKFIYNQLFDDDGNSRCDYAIYYDKLNEGLDELCLKFNLKKRKIKRWHATGGKKHYKDYYNDELISLMKQKCKRELKMFNFNFDGYSGTKALINISKLKIDWREILSEKP